MSLMDTLKNRSTPSALPPETAVPVVAAPVVEAPVGKVVITDIPEEPVVEAPKKRGRPSKAKTEAPPVKADDEVAPLQLFVNCIPSGPYTDLTAYVGETVTAVAQAAQLEDPRISDSGPLAFGKWKGLIAAAAKCAPPTGRCVIWRSDLAEPIIEALAVLAELVVRGI